MRSTYFKEAVTKFLSAIALFNSGKIDEYDYKRLIRISAYIIREDAFAEAQVEDERIEEERHTPREEPETIKD